jgi:site-specific recombinase XerD
MSQYNPINERSKKAYFRYLKEAGRKADSTIDSIRKAISRFETYTGFKDFKTFNKEQAIAFKKHLASRRTVRSGEPMAKSTLLATTNALKDFLKWLSYQPGYKARIKFTDVEYLNLSEKETRAAKATKFKTYPTFEQIRAALATIPSEGEIDRRNRVLLQTHLADDREKYHIPLFGADSRPSDGFKLGGTISAPHGSPQGQLP